MKKNTKNLTVILGGLLLSLVVKTGMSFAVPFDINPQPLANPNIPDIDISVAPSGERNVLLLIADDMGVDLSKQYIPLTGNSPVGMPSTPVIKELRQSGITFHNAWANPVCSPTRAGFLTGRHSFRTGVSNAVGAPGSTALDASETTLPELISGEGYVSGLFGKWHLGGGNMAPNDQGFDHHSGVLSGDLAAYDLWDKYENGVLVAGSPVTQYATEANVQDAADWIQTQANNQNKWLAVVAFNAPHTDNNGDLHTPTANCDGVAAIGTDINGMIECLDYHIEWLLDELSSMGELEKTTIIFIGDNGTDANSIQPPFSNSPNPSHKMEVYEGGIRVPFIISDGYHLEHGAVADPSTGLGYIANPGLRDNTLVHTVDIFATVAGIAGASSTAEDSVSLLRYMGSNILIPRIPRNYIYTDRCTNQMFQAAIRDNHYKIVYRLPFSTGIPQIQLYDATDLEEATDLFGTGITNEAVLLAELDSMWASAGYDPVTTGACP